jgi:hypothetical protein
MFVAIAALLCVWASFNCGGESANPSDGGTDSGLKSCTSNAQCRPSEICRNKVCVPIGTCSKSSDCDGGECVNGKCAAAPDDGGGETDGELDGGPSDVGPGPDGGGNYCLESKDCAPGYRCNTTTHSCEAAAIISLDPPDILNFGAVPYGEEEILPVTITNKGKLSLQITGFEVQNPSGNACFRIASGGTTGTLNPDQFQVVQVAYKQNGAFADVGKLRVASTDKDKGIYALNLKSSYKGLPKFAIVDPDNQDKLYPLPGDGYEYVVDFGYVSQGTVSHKLVAVKNITDGDAILSLNDFSALNTPINKFTAVFREGADPASKLLPIPVSSDNATHIYIPQGVLVYLHIDYDSKNKVDNDEQDYNLITNDNDINASGNVGYNTLTFKMLAKSASSKIEVSPLTLDFKEVQKNATSTKNVTVKNNGDSDLKILASSGIKNTSGTFYSTDPNPLTKTVSAHSSYVIQVTFAPLDIASEVNYLEINSDDKDLPNIEVTLKGKGTDPTLFVTTNPITVGGIMDFGKVIKNSTVTGTFSVTNPGYGTLSISSIVLTQGATNYFQITNFKLNGNTVAMPTPASPLNLRQQAEDTLTFSVTLTPTINGTVSATLKFVNNDIKHTDYTVTMSALSQNNQGDPCQTDDECSTGHCADGVCCKDACDKACERCDMVGYKGTCKPITSGADPKGICKSSSPMTCGQTGNCLGVDNCEMWSPQTVCAGAQCTSANTKLKMPRYCNGEGVCADSTEGTCSPYMCNPNLAVPDCWKMCITDGNCAPGYACDPSNQCKLANGQSCQNGNQCASGKCADDVCCNDTCDKACEMCNQAPNVGTCTAVTAGLSDPKTKCITEDPTTCGYNGLCSGTRGVCQKYGTATQCQDATCSLDKTLSSNPRKCDSQGNCQSQGQLACSPYKCNTQNGLCRLSCTINDDCDANAVCDTSGGVGICKLVIGRTCKSDSECASGFCTEGVCCNERCEDTCETCSLANYKGSCLAVPMNGNSNGKCTKDPVSTCQHTGNCSGTRGVCQMYADGITCAIDSCLVDLITHQRQSLCDGKGNCINGGTENCAPYKCGYDSSTPPKGYCLTSCLGQTDCAPGKTCVSGLCGKPDGESCSSNDECANRGCCGNVCTNIQTDKNNCGGCGVICGTAHASSTTCTAAVCKPTCQAGFAHCNTDPAAGCEKDLSAYPSGAGSSCSNPDDKGSQTGQVQYFSWLSCPSTPWQQFFSIAGSGSKWFKGRATSTCFVGYCDGSVNHQINFTVPAGITYRICTYKGGCGASPSCQEVTNGTYSTTLTNGEEFDYDIKIEYVSGSGCNNWTLSVLGTKC